MLARVLESLAGQTLPAEQWEIVIVDNGSRTPVTLPHHAHLPPCRIVVEQLLGVAAARVRGIREARGELIVFVDDDNLLDSDYLAKAIEIARSFPQIGAFGGRITQESSSQLPAWLEPFRSHLALIDFQTEEWANLPGERAVLPYGAGLCIRREAANMYADDTAALRRRELLGARRDLLRVCEDTDLVLTSLDAGFGAGRFPALHLRHVIPERRLDFGYHKRLSTDIGYSYGRLLSLRGHSSRGRRLIALWKAFLAFLGVKHQGKARAIDVAYHYGFWKGLGSTK